METEFIRSLEQLVELRGSAQQLKSKANQIKSDFPPKIVCFIRVKGCNVLLKAEKSRSTQGTQKTVKSPYI